MQQLTKYGTKENGHMMMFEAIAFANAKDHYLTCDVDICMKNIDGNYQYWDLKRFCKYGLAALPQQKVKIVEDQKSKISIVWI